MRPDRGSTSSPSPTDGDTDAESRAEESRATPVPAAPVPAAPAPAGAPKDEPAREALDDLERAPQGELERPTLVPEIDLQALAKLGPEAFAHSNQRLPADLFGPGGRPSPPVRTSLPPGASMAPGAGSMRPSLSPSVRPKADPFDLDEVDVFFEDNRSSVAPRALGPEDVITEPPHLDLEATAEMFARGSEVSQDARQTSRPPPPLAPHAAPTVRRLEVASLLQSAEEELDEPTLSNRLVPALTPPPSSAPPPPSSLAMPPAPLPASLVLDTSDAIDALGMLDNPDSWDEVAAIAAEHEVSASLRPLAAAALDSLAQLDDPADDDDLGDDLAVPVPSPMPPTRPQPTSPPELDDPVGTLSSPLPPPPIESLPSDLLADDDSTDDLSGASDPVADAGADEAMAELRERFAAQDYLGALQLAETLTNDPLHAQESEEIAAVCRSTLQARYVESIGSLARVPVIAVPLSIIRELPIDNRAGFVLSRIDGISSLEMILDMCGMPQLDALRIVYELVQNGALDFV